MVRSKVPVNAGSVHCGALPPTIFCYPLVAIANFLSSEGNRDIAVR
jgi:hypothetical protein